MGKRDRLTADDLLNNRHMTPEARERVEKALREQGVETEAPKGRKMRQSESYPDKGHSERMTSLGVTERELNKGCYRLVGIAVAGVVALILGLVILFSTIGLLARITTHDEPYVQPKPKVERRLKK